MQVICETCGEDWDSDTHGYITIGEKAPIHMAMDDNLYFFCTYYCMKGWLK